MLHNVLVNLAQVNVGDLGLITIEDLGDLLESGSAGLDVEDGNEDEFEEDPALVEISNCSQDFPVVNQLTA